MTRTERSYGRPITAHEAHHWGLVNEVVPPGDLLPAARRWAAEILQCAPLSVWAGKQAALEGSSLPLADAINRQYELMRRWMVSADRIEGPRAFNEKRRPIWQGR